MILIEKYQIVQTRRLVKILIQYIGKFFSSYSDGITSSELVIIHGKGHSVFVRTKMSLYNNYMY
jgi:hypothetical protein